MKCMVCSNLMGPYFTKHFNSAILGSVEYVRCQNCGFVLSKTHTELSDDDWHALNKEYHGSYQGRGENFDNPRWIARLQDQAEVISDINRLGLIPQNFPWIDFECGDGPI